MLNTAYKDEISMAFANVNIGTNPADGTGDPLRTAFQKINQNFANIATTGNPGPVTRINGRQGDVTLTANDIVGTVTKGYVDGADIAGNIYVDQRLARLEGNVNANVVANVASSISNQANILLQSGSALQPVNANVTAANAAIAGLQSTVSTLSSTVDSINSGLGTATTNIATLTSNAALQSSQIAGANAAIITANSAVVQFVLTQDTLLQSGINGANAAIVTANTAMKGYVDAVKTAWTANAATQAGQIANLIANQGVVDLTYANVAIANLQSNAGVQAGNIAYLTGQVGSINTNLTTFENINLGNQSNITLLQSGATATNVAIVTANTAMKAYVDTFNSALTTNVNNINSNIISTQTYANAVSSLGSVSGSVTINVKSAIHQKLTTSGSITNLSFTNWPSPGTAGSVTVDITVSSKTHTITFGNAASFNPLTVLVGLNGVGTWSVPVAGTYSLTFTSTDGGATINLVESNPFLRNYNPSSEILVTASNSAISLAHTYTTFVLTANGTAFLGNGVPGQIKVIGSISTGFLCNVKVAASAGAAGGQEYINLYSNNSTPIGVQLIWSSQLNSGCWVQMSPSASIANDITTLTANAGTQATSIASINNSISNINNDLVIFETEVINNNANVANVQVGMTLANASIAALTSNAGAQANQILAINANVTAANAAIIAANLYQTNSLTNFRTYANTNFLTTSYTNSNVAIYLPTYAGNISAGNIMSDRHLFANGVNILSTVAGLYSNANVASYLPTHSGDISGENVIFTGNLFAGYSPTSVHHIRGNVLFGNGTVGLSTDSIITINLNNSIPLVGANNTVHLSGADNKATYYGVDAFGANVASGMFGRKARGTSASPSAVQAGDDIVTFAGKGYGTAAFSNSAIGASSISIVAAENYTQTNQGTEIHFHIIKLGANVVNPATPQVKFSANTIQSKYSNHFILRAKLQQG